MSDNAYILDNGAYMAKVGYSNNKPKLVPNCIMKAKSERRRPFIGDQVEECRDASGLYYILAFQKGFLLNWDTQKTIWDYMFSKDCCSVNFNETPLIVTEPLFNFASIQEGMTEIFFEEYECQSLLRINSTDLCDYNYRKTHGNPMCSLVVDVGYSFTNIVPYIRGKKHREGIRRIDVGGKVLTNHLKEIISYRQLNVMDETYVINQVKEDTCFVSQDFMKDMEIAKQKPSENTIVREYVLPDYTSIRRGYIKDVNSKEESEQQTLRMNNERFSIPELLFFPSDVGIQQMGISEAVMEVVRASPEETQPHLLANIIVCGGSATFPGFRDRLFKDVRSMAPEHLEVKVKICLLFLFI